MANSGEISAIFYQKGFYIFSEYVTIFYEKPHTDEAGISLLFTACQPKKMRYYVETERKREKKDESGKRGKGQA